MIVEARLTGFFSTGSQPEKVYVKHKICTSFHCLPHTAKLYNDKLCHLGLSE